MLEYLDLGFHQSEPWSQKFIWIGYDSTNSVQLLGSIFIIILYLAFKGLMMLLVNHLKLMVRVTCLRRFLDKDDFKQGLVRFLHETLFELLICSLLGFKMLEIRSIWNFADLFAFVFGVVVLFASVVFAIYSVYYAVCKLRPLSNARKVQKDLELQLRIEEMNN